MFTPLPPSPDELVEIEFFIACDPFAAQEEESAGPEMLAFFAGAIIGGLGFEHLAHLIEGSEHLGDLTDALRPQLNSVQVQAAMAAYRRNPPRIAPGEVQGVWVRTFITRRSLRNAIAMTAPSNRPRLAPVSAPVLRRASAAPAFRPRAPRPTWA